MFMALKEELYNFICFSEIWGTRRVNHRSLGNSVRKMVPSPLECAAAIVRRKIKWHIHIFCMDGSKTGKTATRVQGRPEKLLSPLLAALELHLLPQSHLWSSEAALVFAFFCICFKAGCLLDQPFTVSGFGVGGSNLLYQCLHFWGRDLGYFPRVLQHSLCWSDVHQRQTLVWLQWPSMLFGFNPVLLPKCILSAYATSFPQNLHNTSTTFPSSGVGETYSFFSFFFFLPGLWKEHAWIYTSI